MLEPLREDDRSVDVGERRDQVAHLEQRLVELGDAWIWIASIQLGIGRTSHRLGALGDDLEDREHQRLEPPAPRRVVHRVMLGVEHPPRAGAAALDDLARHAVPSGSAHDWNSAMMDLGATICTARAPKCLVCPLRNDCAAAPIDPISLTQAARNHARPGSPQSAIPFERTTRFLRGRIIDRLRDVPPRESIAEATLTRWLADVVPHDRLDEIPSVVDTLVREGIVARIGRAVRLS